jgi:SAM-dependent methyltransferase
MLEYVSAKAAAEGIEVNCVHAGFLTFNGVEEYDAVVSGAAMHHLPDVWKSVAVRNIYNALKSGGQFLLRDVVFDWEADKHNDTFEAFVNSFPEETRISAARHAAKEYSTHNWIIEGILQRVGFSIVSNIEEAFYFRQYHCRKA